MRKIILISILFLATFSKVFTQSTYENLEKYWYYRERLNNFVLESSNYNEPGTNIPADRILGDKISWDDGNAAFNHYISMLATEYKLLKLYGQDYTQTIKELYYALKSFERLDATAESYYRSDNSQLDLDLNGFYIREDITTNFWEKYSKNGSSPYFKQAELDRKLDPNDPEDIWSGHYEKSEDNTWHYLEAFSLVKVLVDNEYVDGVLINFKQIAEDNVYRIINDMIHNNLIHTIAWQLSPPSYIKNDLAYKWYVENPVTGEEVQLGSGTDGTMLYVSYGFAQAGNNILGSNTFAPPYYSKVLFQNMLSAPITEMSLSLNVYNRVIPVVFVGFIDVELAITGPNYNLTVVDFVNDPPLYKTIDSWSTNLANISFDDYELRSLCSTGNIRDSNGLSPYKVLIKKQNESNVLKYEHFPLMWSINNNNFTYMSKEDKEYIYELLNAAPACGPYYFGPGDDGGLWSSSSRLVWPEKLHGGCTSGEYNGLDYMLLHNLYWLSTISQYPQNVSYNPSIHQSNSLIATNQITCSVPVEITDNSMEFIAGNKIKLLPGFSVYGYQNNSFGANISENLESDYKELTLTDYNGCNDFIDIKESVNNSKNVDESQISSNTVDQNENPLNVAFNNEINVFPNPVEDKLNVVSKHNIGIKKIEIYNNINTMVFTQDYQSVDLVKINTIHLTNGIYFVKIKDMNDQIHVKKIIKL
ncbi:T9SS type A sorting domain-containing protein [Bacteroidota bacterium]